MMMNSRSVNPRTVHSSSDPVFRIFLPMVRSRRIEASELMVVVIRGIRQDRRCFE